MTKCRFPLHLTTAVPIIFCLALLTVAGSAFADCRISRTQAPSDLSWYDPRPTAIEQIAEIHDWKPIKLGLYRETRTLGIALEQAGCVVGSDADAMLNSGAFPLAHAPREIDLVVVSVAQLGFPREASRAAIFARVKDLGLQLCPPEVGPLLRLQYPEQPPGEFLRVAMEPVRLANGELQDFIVGNGGGAGQVLVGAAARSDQTLSWNVLLVFARDRSRSSMTATAQP